LASLHHLNFVAEILRDACGALLLVCATLRLRAFAEYNGFSFRQNEKSQRKTAKRRVTPIRDCDTASVILRGLNRDSFLCVWQAAGLP
jgi:hypothetical protein